MKETELSWKTAWVTGSSSGLGYEFAKLLADEALHVAVSARSAEKLDKLSAYRKSLKAYPLDVTDASAIKTCVEKIELEHGPIDLAVLNAGTWQFMQSSDMDFGAIRHGIEVNYMGVINSLQAILPGMLSRKRGHIAITASVSGYRGLPGAVAYGPTKAALINLAETLKLELAPHGILVSLVNPGFVDTPMTRKNNFAMPSLMSADVAAEKMLEGLKKQRFEIIFPVGFVLMMKLLKRLPNTIYFWVIRRFIMK